MHGPLLDNVAIGKEEQFTGGIARRDRTFGLDDYADS